MNVRLIVFSGIMTALIGAMVGIALAHISQRDMRKQSMIVGGATLGFVVGSASSMIMQQRQERAEDYRDSDRFK